MKIMVIMTTIPKDNCFNKNEIESMISKIKTSISQDNIIIKTLMEIAGTQIKKEIESRFSNFKEYLELVFKFIKQLLKINVLDIDKSVFPHEHLILELYNGNLLDAIVHLNQDSNEYI